MNVGLNRSILISSSITLGIGVLNAIVHDRPISNVVQGGMVVMSLLALLDALSPTQFGALAAALASIAAIASVLNELPDVLKAFGIFK